MKHQKNNNSKDSHRKTVGEWLLQKVEWRIPVYQRHYAWGATKSETGPIDLFWETVAEQTRDRLKGDKVTPHYLGAVLVDNKTDPQEVADDMRYYDVVDGQQRLTTIQIAMLALIRTADEHGCGNTIRKELEKHVFADEAHTRPRLIPTNFDQRKFQAVLNDAYDVIWNIGVSKVSRDNAGRSKIDSAFEFFKEKHDKFVGNRQQGEAITAIRALMDTLTKGFDLVLIVLNKDDNARRIFESLNSVAVRLTTFDLIRNNVFHRASDIRSGMDEELFNTDIWQQLEKPYWEDSASQREGESPHIEAYVARMLVARMKKEIRFNPSDIFRSYKKFADGFSNDIGKEIGELVRYADIYRFLASNMGEVQNPVTPPVDFGVFRYAVWKNRDLYPVLFLIADSGANSAQKERMLRLLESYVIRRGVCGLPTDNYNNYAASVCKELGDNADHKVLDEFLKDSEDDSALFPDNKKVMEASISANLYKLPFLLYVFRQIEAFICGSKADVDAKKNLTIDHILPKKWEKDMEWRKLALGDNGQHDDAAAFKVNSHLNTIGNLTIMSGGRNTAKSNRSFGEIRGLLSDSGLKLNRELADKEAWNVEEITARSRELAEKICEIWPYDVE